MICPPARLRGVAEAPSQPYQLTASQHGALLHGSRPGHVAVATRFPGDKWREKAYPVGDLPEVLEFYAGQPNVYLSTQRFFWWRRLARLRELGALRAAVNEVGPPPRCLLQALRGRIRNARHADARRAKEQRSNITAQRYSADVDFYKRPALRHSHPLGVLEDCLVALERARKPRPSLAIASGQGLALLWLHSPVPRQALPRWNACQKELWQILKPFGADRQALDAARVLRLIDSRHSKADVLVEALAPVGDVWDFDVLADEVLPLERAELFDLRVQRAARHANKQPKRRPVPPNGFSVATLQEARLSDYQRLRELRWFGEPMPDFRDRWLFLSAVAMSWLAVPAVLQRELYALAREVGGWSEGWTRSKMHAVFRTAREAAEGHTVEWEGRRVSPLYRFRNETIIEWLEITDEEQKEMRTLISPTEKARRREEKARQVGAMGREEYKVRAARRRAEARRMYSEVGKSAPEIAKALGVSVHTVNSYVYGRR
jgi:hypothetical protein